MKKSRVLWLVLGVLLAASLACAVTDAAGGGASGASLTVINNTASATICYVYISPITEDTWGDDWLGATEVISPGGSRTITGIEPGDYDLLAQDCDHNDLVDRRGVTLDGSTEWTISD